MRALLRNPLYRFVARLWWTPMILGLAILTLGEAHLWQASLVFVGLGFSFLITTTLVAWHHGLREKMRAHQLAADERHRFLCSECLRFSEPAYACGSCGKECDSFVLETGGGYVNDCAHCHAILLPPEREEAVGLLAYCRHCRATSDRYPHHERRVCVIGVPTRADLAHFPHASLAECRVAVTEAGLRLDDRSWLTYVLRLDALAHQASAPDHVARQLDALWLAGTGMNPLELGEQLDGFIRRARLSGSERKQLRICLGCSQKALPQEVYNVLEGRFPNPARLEFDVRPEALIEQLSTLPDEEAGRVRPQVLAVLNSNDWSTLRTLKDQYGGPLLHLDGWCRQPGGLTVRVYNQEVVRPKALDCALELFGLEAVWLSGRDENASVIGQVDRLLELVDLSGDQRRGLVICVAEHQPSPLLLVALQARFRTVRTGVTAEEFLWHGRGARAPALLVGPTHILATCLPGDFETLFREMGSLQRERLRAEWAVEETGNRTSYLVDLSNPTRMPSNFGDTPALGEVQAVWLGETLPHALELAEQLDGLIRGVWGSEQRRRDLVVCLWSATSDPAIRNVLEARFGAVRYGVSAREFLEHGSRAANRERLIYEDAPVTTPRPLQRGN